jgi:LAGLIDADG endonuclease
MNYILPVQCGAVDMANKNKNLNLSLFNKKNLLSKNYSINIQLKNNDLILSYYLAGLIEGDGYISINNKNRVILGITFNKKDLYLAEKILIYFKQGFIVKRKTNSIELRFTSIKVLKKIITLINGKLRTPKIDQLYKLID